MPFYRFIVHGRDVNFPDGTRGFYTTRRAFASSEEEAAAKVLSLLAEEFTTGVSADVWESDPPLLSIEKSWSIGLHQLFSAPNKGSSFYDKGGWKESYDLEYEVSRAPRATANAG